MDYKTKYNQSLNSKDYWLNIANEFTWFTPPTKDLSSDFTELPISCFKDGQLNITQNVLDIHAKNTPNKIAISWEPNDPSEAQVTYTYRELLERVCQFSNVLSDNNVQKGDTVCFYMSMIPELLIGALACARVGAVHSVVFGGFSSNALAQRVQDCESKIVITNDEGPRGNKVIPLKEICDAAVKECPSVNKVLVVQRTFNEDIKYTNNHVVINELLDKAKTTFSPEVMNAEDPLFILYTSGSTGKPKGLVHTCAGYMIWAKETFKHVFQANSEDDIFWCTADIGWITGHSYMTYGPLLNGVSQVMFEGIPTYPTPSRFWDVVEKYKVTHFYTAPTAIRALQACSPEFIDNANLETLKVLGSVGEPINIEAWNWYNEKVGNKKCPIVDTWWQTENGGIMISNLAGVTPTIACHATLPLFGVEPILVDPNGKEILGNPAEGNLCIKRPWPGLARTIFNDHKRYEETYFTTYPGYYFTGDGARRDKDGNYRITGRVDDVINVSGHRIGTAEVEDVINEHSKIVESAVVGFDHEIKGQGLMAFAIIDKDLELSQEEMIKEVNTLLTKMIGPIAKLDRLILSTDLPKTRSGKIMRRVLRKLANNQADQIGDTSTLLNPECVDELIKKL